MSERPDDDNFRWQAFFQRSQDAIFVLNRQCYLVFANHAWEQLTSLSLEEAKRMSCRRHARPTARASWKTHLCYMMTPSEEIREGQSGRLRRIIPARGTRPSHCWDVDFFPMHDNEGLCGIVGRITVAEPPILPNAAPIPQAVATLREQHQEAFRTDRLIARLPVMKRVHQQIQLASKLDVPGTLIGNEGTGKQSLARMIHAQSRHREQSFVALDCQRLPGIAIESILTGESKAVQTMGTLYLKEPGALKVELQTLLVKLLNEDEEGLPRILVGVTSYPSENLLPELRHLLNTFCIEVPTLIERRDDLPHLIAQFFPSASLTPDAWEKVLSYTWPGNLRELDLSLRFAFHHSEKETIDAEDLPAQIRDALDPTVQLYRPQERTLDLKAILEEAERRIIERTLKHTKGQRTKAAEMLSIWRAALIRRIEALNINIPAPSQRPKKSQPEEDDSTDVPF